ncbi:WxcM-like domain-containing protein [Flavobacterium sp.]|jgi:dTDP-4-dehydrorhamnose 3,5-epimerase-like enzyme|uniref:WxcM-like domain-containing protein n=1 Tax=Flavobacterium sp. TaxID=239 RepID=UPI0037C01DCE
MRPKIIKGEFYSDSRGTLFYNNDFDASDVKRVYIIENVNTDFNRAWQGHKIEQRWFSAIQGSFKIQLVSIDDWDNPSKDLNTMEYILECDKLDILYVPKGYANSIQSLEVGSKLLVMANYFLGEIEDEYRYALDYFDKKQE